MLTVAASKVQVNRKLCAADEVTLRVLVERQRHGTVEASRRHTADVVGCTDRTARRILRRLRDAKKITAVGRDFEHDRGRAYKVPILDNANLTPLSAEGDLALRGGKFASLASHDAWRAPHRGNVKLGKDRTLAFGNGGGLGKAKMLIYCDLSPKEPRRTDHLVKRRQRSRQMIEKHLKEMVKLGLVRKHKNGWLQGDRDLDDLAVELGVAGEGAKQRKQHRAEVAQWKVARRLYRQEKRKKIDEETGEVIAPDDAEQQITAHLAGIHDPTYLEQREEPVVASAQKQRRHVVLKHRGLSVDHPAASMASAR